MNNGNYKRSGKRIRITPYINKSVALTKATIENHVTHTNVDTERAKIVDKESNSRTRQTKEAIWIRKS